MSTFFAWVWFLGLVVVGVLLLVEKWQREKDVGKLSEEKDRLEYERGQLASKVTQLSQYQGIADIEEEISRLQKQIEAEKHEAQASVNQLLQDGQNRAAEQEEALKVAKQALKQMQKDAEEGQAALLGRASAESSRIIEEANRKAQAIAGDAYTALRDMEHIKATAKAMENAIKGYGDEYLIPNHAALDDLAAEYTHKQAGLDLQTARARTRQMVATGIAASCDYAESARKQTAIRFVLDAFNGKVDSALSSVRHNNYGKLRQEIIDAFSLVNEHGKAFRNARILPEFMESRLTELKWAVAVMELQLQEREEQRRIQQEMREEEKARREYEKAIKDAAKEEALIKKLMDEAQEKLKAANAEERAEYERKIQELEVKYREAEERNQRAISMAQQTKRGHVYVISNEGSFGEEVFKIGLTRRLDPLNRVKELSDASVPFDFDVHAMIYNDDAPCLETTLHRVFADFQVNKVNPRKEFFRIGIKDIREVLEKIGIDAKWTMVAEAKEYRETMAMERESGLVKTIREPDPDIATELARSESAPPANHGVEQIVQNASVAASQSGEDPAPLDDADAITTSESIVAEEPQLDSCVPCPMCEGELLISVLKGGLNTCPHCNGEFEVDM